jgi:hypothetical protein
MSGQCASSSTAFGVDPSVFLLMTGANFNVKGL